MQAATHLNLTVDEAKRYLDSVVLDGHARYSTGADGWIAYHLGELGMQQSPRRRQPDVEMERQLVRLALQRGGRLTTAEVVAHLPLTLDEAKRRLDELASAGHVGYEVEDDGRITYRLADAVEAEPRPEETIRVTV